jgi:hypothetical protein
MDDSPALFKMPGYRCFIHDGSPALGFKIIGKIPDKTLFDCE